MSSSVSSGLTGCLRKLLISLYLFLEGNALDVFLPISARDSQEEIETQNKYVTIKTNRSNGTRGVATHYQNDGSPLYLLTPNILPPSVGSVQRWLLCDERGTY